MSGMSGPNKRKFPTIVLRKRKIENEETVKDNSLESQFKKMKLSKQNSKSEDESDELQLPDYYPAIQGCRSVTEYQFLKEVDEGTYGVVFKAKNKQTNEVVALKRLKRLNENSSFPINSLREISILLRAQHPNIVALREVVSSSTDQIFIVMEYVDYDLRSLLGTMQRSGQVFTPDEIKCLLLQILRGVHHLHDNWILHRDLKPSNILIARNGILKIADFGMARDYGSPLKCFTLFVVSQWYRAPELLLGISKYSTFIDMWSVGCIFGELLQIEIMFKGLSQKDQLTRIYEFLGTPNEDIWPGYNDLHIIKNVDQNFPPFNSRFVSLLHKTFVSRTTAMGLSLLQGMLCYDPRQRMSAENALNHSYFKESPLPIDPSMFRKFSSNFKIGYKGPFLIQPLSDQLQPTESDNGFKLPNSLTSGFQLKF